MAALASSLIAALEEAKAESRGDYIMFRCTILDVVDLIEAEDDLGQDRVLAECLVAIRYPAVADIGHIVAFVRTRLAVAG